MVGTSAIMIVLYTVKEARIPKISQDSETVSALSQPKMIHLFTTRG